jgi:hypothetical protein
MVLAVTSELFSWMKVATGMLLTFLPKARLSVGFA